MTPSAVQFDTLRRVHIGLAVADTARSTAFYQTLFEVAPTKTRAGYARFEVVEPPLNLSLIQTPGAYGPADSVSHFGVQVQSTEAVVDMTRRLESAGLFTRREESVQCCHAVQNKTWIADPDGYQWEIFVVLDDAPTAGTEDPGECCSATPDEPCCADSGEPCCVEE